MLSQNDKYGEFARKFRALVAEGQKVDQSFAIETMEVGNSRGRWETPAEVPLIFTQKGEQILPENAKF